MSGRSEVVQFEFGQPVEVALKFADPKVIETQYGERAMYTLADERIMFHDLLTAAKIKALGVAPGDCFHIVKRKKGRVSEYEVFTDAQEPAKPGRPILVSEAVIEAAHAPVPSNPTGKKLAPARDLAKVIPAAKFAGNGNLEQTLEQSIAVTVGYQPDGTFAVPAPPPVERKPVAQAQSSEPAWAAVLIAQTNHLVDCYAAALAHASKHGTAVKSDDVRNLLVTSFIQLSQKGGRNAA